MGHLTEGYGWPSNSQKGHWFRDGRSLCGKWMYLGILTEAHGDAPDICTACKKILEREKARQKLNELKQKGKIQL